MYWTDGSCYKGEWMNGIQNGLGAMKFPDGRVKEGIFKNNIFQNPVTDLNQVNKLKAQEILLKNNFKEST